MLYCTLYQLRQYLELETTETADDNLLTRLLKEIHFNIDEWSGRRFDVRYEARSYDYPVKAREPFGVYNADQWISQWNNYVEQQVNGRLRLDDDLLSLTTLTNGDGSTIASTSYVLEPANRYPKFAVQLKRATEVNWQLPTDGHREQIISVAGLWGYHTRYGDRAWISSLDTVQNNPLASGGTSLQVSDADGLSGDGEQQRFQAGQMLRLSDDDNYEFVDVLAVDNSTNILTISRAYNGTTARQWIQGTVIDIFRPMENIVRAARRWAKYVYRQKDVDTMDTTSIIGTGVQIVPSMMPPDVKALLPSPRRGLDQSGLL